MRLRIRYRWALKRGRNDIRWKYKDGWRRGRTRTERCSRNTAWTGSVCVHFRNRDAGHAGVGIIVPVLPKLIIRFEHGDMAMAATQTGIFAFAWAAMQFVFSP